MDSKTTIKDYFSQIWPEITGVCCSILFTILTNKTNISIGWVILISLSPWFFVFPFHHWLRTKKKQVTQHMVSGNNNCAISCLNEMRRISHKYPSDNTDYDRLNKDMTEMCEQVFRTLAQFDDKYRTIGYDKYCVFVSLLDKKNNNDILINPLYRNHSEWSDSIFKKIPTPQRLKDNSPYEEIYYSYRDYKKPKIIMTSHIKNKLADGKYRSSYANQVGLHHLPYDSSCVIPILPFHNDRNGDEIQGFLTVVSEMPDAFSKDAHNREADAYFETVSGFLYKICVKTKIK